MAITHSIPYVDVPYVSHAGPKFSVRYTDSIIPPMVHLLLVYCLLRRFLHMVIKRSLWVGRKSLELRLALLLVVCACVDTLSVGGSILLLSSCLLLGRRGLTSLVLCRHVDLVLGLVNVS